MAVAFVNKQLSGTATSTNPFTPTMPGSIVADNLLVMSVLLWETAKTVSTPGGWSLVIDGDVTFGSSSGARFYVFIKKAVGGDTAPSISASGNGYWSVLIEQYTGQDLTTPLDGTASHGAVTAGSPVPNPAITTTVDDSMVLYFEADTTATGSVTVPSGATERQNGGNPANGFRIVASDLLQATAGVVAATSHTRTSTTSSALGSTMAIKAAEAPPSSFVPRVIASY